MHYQVIQLKDQGKPGAIGLVSICQGAIAEQVVEQGGTVYGIFTGLFGLASNELYLVTCSDKPVSVALPAGVSEVNRWHIRPTVRPVEHASRDVPGIYVFRWFDVAPDTVDEIVDLSNAAWPSFESDFDARIQGLFVEESDQPTKMVLLTWYRDLSVWEDSRKPSAESRENFIKRHQLTREALPVATTLV